MTFSDSDWNSTHFRRRQRAICGVPGLPQFGQNFPVEPVGVVAPVLLVMVAALAHLTCQGDLRRTSVLEATVTAPFFHAVHSRALQQMVCSGGRSRSPTTIGESRSNQLSYTAPIDTGIRHSGPGSVHRAPQRNRTADLFLPAENALPTEPMASDPQGPLKRYSLAFQHQNRWSATNWQRCEPRCV